MVGCIKQRIRQRHDLQLNDIETLSTVRLAVFTCQHELGRVTRASHCRCLHCHSSTEPELTRPALGTDAVSGYGACPTACLLSQMPSMTHNICIWQSWRSIFSAARASGACYEDLLGNMLISKFGEIVYTINISPKP